MVRADHADQVYKTVNGKYRAVIEQVVESHAKGQPVLVGTISIERSELLSKLLKKRGVKHEVLNAKFHEKEAQIVAQAGRKGAVTIATNMAGRGTDIVLGGNAEFAAKEEMRKRGFTEELLVEATGHADTDDAEILEARRVYDELYSAKKVDIDAEAEEVKAAGGLFIIGTERHESRRIDNQLRGRAGRQGDAGESRFYLSLEDDLMRLFGSERVQNMMDTLGVDEDTPIENRMITSSIESAQRKIEGRNFEARKNVLRFDDVMNSQREIIYGQRQQVLRGDDVSESIQSMIRESIAGNVTLYCAGDDPDEWNLEALRDHYLNWLTTDDDFRYTEAELEKVSREAITEELQTRAADKCKAKEEKYGEGLMREIERTVLLRNVVMKWMDHIDAMDELRKGIGLRAIGQRDPVQEYKFEGYNMFDEMTASIKEDTVRGLFLFRLRENREVKRTQMASPEELSAVGGGEKAARPARRETRKVGRNDPCPCGSGKKYKHCCYDKDRLAK